MKAAIALAIVAVLLATAGTWIHFKVWRIQHPTAPAWTYWINS